MLLLFLWLLWDDADADADALCVLVVLPQCAFGLSGERPWLPRLSGMLPNPASVNLFTLGAPSLRTSIQVHRYFRPGWVPAFGRMGARVRAYERIRVRVRVCVCA